MTPTGRVSRAQKYRLARTVRGARTRAPPCPLLGLQSGPRASALLLQPALPHRPPRAPRPAPPDPALVERRASVHPLLQALLLPPHRAPLHPRPTAPPRTLLPHPAPSHPRPTAPPRPLLPHPGAVGRRASVHLPHLLHLLTPARLDLRPIGSPRQLGRHPRGMTQTPQEPSHPHPRPRRPGRVRRLHDVVLPAPARRPMPHLPHRARQRPATPQPAEALSPITRVDLPHSTRRARPDRAPVTRLGRKRSAPGIRPCPTIPGLWWNHRRKPSTPAPGGDPSPRIPTTVDRRRPASTRPPARTVAADSGADVQRRRVAAIRPSGPAHTPPPEEWASGQVVLSAQAPAPQDTPTVPIQRPRPRAHRAPLRPDKQISTASRPPADHLGRRPPRRGEPISRRPSGPHHAVSCGALPPLRRTDRPTDRRTATQGPSTGPIPGTDCRRRRSLPSAHPRPVDRTHRLRPMDRGHHLPAHVPPAPSFRASSAGTLLRWTAVPVPRPPPRAHPHLHRRQEDPLPPSRPATQRRGSAHRPTDRPIPATRCASRSAATRNCSTRPSGNGLRKQPLCAVRSTSASSRTSRAPMTRRSRSPASWAGPRSSGSSTGGSSRSGASTVSRLPAPARTASPAAGWSR